MKNTALIKPNVLLLAHVHSRLWLCTLRLRLRRAGAPAVTARTQGTWAAAGQLAPAPPASRPGGPQDWAPGWLRSWGTAQPRAGAVGEQNRVHGNLPLLLGVISFSPLPPSLFHDRLPLLKDLTRGLG